MRTYVVDQLTDPRAVCLLSLDALGYQDTLEIDPQGYGIDKGEVVFATGNQLLKTYQRKQNFFQADTIFNRSRLQAAPLGEEGRKQKNIAINKLAIYLSRVIYDLLTSVKKSSASSLPPSLKFEKPSTMLSPIKGIIKVSSLSLYHTFTYAFAGKD